jgi:hypothetical protein
MRVVIVEALSEMTEHLGYGPVNEESFTLGLERVLDTYSDEAVRRATLRLIDEFIASDSERFPAVARWVRAVRGQPISGPATKEPVYNAIISFDERDKIQASNDERRRWAGALVATSPIGHRALFEGFGRHLRDTLAQVARNRDASKSPRPTVEEAHTIMRSMPMLSPEPEQYRRASAHIIVGHQYASLVESIFNQETAS